MDPCFHTIAYGPPVPVYEATYPADFTHSEYNFLVRRGSGNSCRYILRAPGQREQTRRERERSLCDCRGDTCSEGNGVDSRLLAGGMLGPWIYCML